MQGRSVGILVLIGIVAASSSATPARRRASRAAQPPGTGARTLAQSKALVGRVMTRITDRVWDRGEYYWHVGRYTDRIATDRLVIRMEPTFIEAYSTSGFLLENTGKEDQALQTYRRATEVAPQKWETWHDLGWFYLQHKSFPDAIRSYDRAVKLKGVPVFVWKNLAHAYEKDGQLKKALDTWEKIRYIDAADGTIDLNEKRIQQKLKDGTGAGERS
jgi:tetratricopeptide (TPR) repeat protein